jgi:hypothetical protein
MRQIGNHYADDKVVNQVEHAEIFWTPLSGRPPVRDGFWGHPRAMVINFYFAAIYRTSERAHALSAARWVRFQKYDSAAEKGAAVQTKGQAFINMRHLIGGDRKPASSAVRGLNPPPRSCMFPPQSRNRRSFKYDGQETFSEPTRRKSS